MSMKKVTHIVVHYSATFSDQTITAADIDKMHKARGWKGIGYHYFIRRDGRVEKGRPDSVVGAHVGGQNSGKIGICWAGGLERSTGANKGRDNRTHQQTSALIKLIKELKEKWPQAQVVGHRDLASTQCPGFDVRPWWQKIEMGTAVSAPKPKAAVAKDPVVTFGVNEGDVYLAKEGDTLWSIGRTYGVSAEEIARANGVSEESTLRVGQELVIPEREEGRLAALVAALTAALAAIATYLASGE